MPAGTSSSRCVWSSSRCRRATHCSRVSEGGRSTNFTFRHTGPSRRARVLLHHTLAPAGTHLHPEDHARRVAAHGLAEQALCDLRGRLGVAARQFLPQVLAQRLLIAADQHRYLPVRQADPRQHLRLVSLLGAELARWSPATVFDVIVHAAHARQSCGRRPRSVACCPVNACQRSTATST